MTPPSDVGRGLVPPNVLHQLHDLGVAALEARVNETRISWEPFFSQVVPAWQRDPERTVAELHAAAGTDPYAQFGGHVVVTEFDRASRDPLALDLCDAGLELMHSIGLSSGSLTGFEARRWTETHGDLRTSFDGIEEIMPPPSDALLGSLPQLEVGETLLLAAMGPGDTDNQFYAERRADGNYSVFSIRPESSQNPVPTRYEEPTLGTSDDLQDVLSGLGEYLRTQTYWSHEALQPYFIERRAPTGATHSGGHPQRDSLIRMPRDQQGDMARRPRNDRWCW